MAEFTCPLTDAQKMLVEMDIAREWFHSRDEDPKHRFGAVLADFKSTKAARGSQYHARVLVAADAADRDRETRFAAPYPCRRRMPELEKYAFEFDYIMSTAQDDDARGNTESEGLSCRYMPKKKGINDWRL